MTILILCCDFWHCLVYLVAKWKEAGFLESLFLRQTKNGAVLIFKDIDETKAKELMETLPLYKLKKSVEYYALIKQF